MVGRADRQRDVPEERVDLLVEEHEGVAPQYQTAPDHTIMNNYSTYPNINPYTGQQGRIQPYGWPAVNSYTYPRYLPR